jgi:hypothetical protein
MTKQGTINLAGVVLLPAAAVLGAALATMNGAFNAYGATYVFVIIINCIITIPAALLSGLLLRWSGGDRSRWVAILPMLVPVAIGSVWYIWRGIIPAAVAPGAEYIGAPQYLMVIMLVAAFIALLLRVTGIVSRAD